MENYDSRINEDLIAIGGKEKYEEYFEKIKEYLKENPSRTRTRDISEGTGLSLETVNQVVRIGESEGRIEIKIKKGLDEIEEENNRRRQERLNRNANRNREILDKMREYDEQRREDSGSKLVKDLRRKMEDR